VYKDSPAEQGGLKEGDLIVAFNQQNVQATRELVNMVSATEVGKRVLMQVLRADKEIMLSMDIGAAPGEPEVTAIQPPVTQPAGFRGLTVEPITPLHKNNFQLKEDEGVVVVAIEPNSPAARSGLEVGDVISKVENKKIAAVEDFKAIIAEIKGNCLIKTSRGYFVLKESK
jgi:serine protease Do